MKVEGVLKKGSLPFSAEEEVWKEEVLEHV